MTVPLFASVRRKLSTGSRTRLRVVMNGRCLFLIVSIAMACGGGQAARPAPPPPPAPDIKGNQGVKRPGVITVEANTAWHELSLRLFGKAPASECYLVRGRGIEQADNIVIRHSDKDTAVVATCHAEDLIQWLEGRAPWGEAHILPVSADGRWIPERAPVRVLFVARRWGAVLDGPVEMGIGAMGVGTFLDVYAPKDDDLIVAVLPPEIEDASTTTRLPEDDIRESSGLVQPQTASKDAPELGWPDIEPIIRENLGAMTACASDRALEGALTVQWLIDVNGRVVAARSVFPSRVHRDTERCILDVFQRMTFPVRSNLPAAPILPLRLGG